MNRFLFHWKLLTTFTAELGWIPLNSNVTDLPVRGLSIATALRSTFWKMSYPWFRQQGVLMSTACCGMSQSGKWHGECIGILVGVTASLFSMTPWRKGKFIWLDRGVKIRTSSSTSWGEPQPELNRSLVKFHEWVSCCDRVCNIQNGLLTLCVLVWTYFMI